MNSTAPWGGQKPPHKWPPHSWETHPAEASDDLLQVGKGDEAVLPCQLDDPIHLLDHHSSYGLAHTELVGSAAEGGGDSELLYGNSNFLQK